MGSSQIYIRPILMEDAGIVLDWENNEENWGVSENGSKYSLFDIIVLIKELQDIKKSMQARWMICLENTGEAIGNVDLTEINFEAKEATVGILIADKKYRNKGMAIESLRLVEGKALELDLLKLNCTIHEDNTSSINLFLKNDYEKIGETNDSELKNGEYINIILFEKWLKK